MKKTSLKDCLSFTAVMSTVFFVLLSFTLVSFKEQRSLYLQKSIKQRGDQEIANVNKIDCILFSEGGMKHSVPRTEQAMIFKNEINRPPETLMRNRL